MSTIFNPTVGTGSSLAYTGLATLASATYVQNTTAYDCSTNDPMEAVIEVNLTPGTVSGNKRALVFISESMDGTVFRSGPTSGTTTTRQQNLRQLGQIPLTTNAQAETKFFPIAARIGYMPKKFNIIIFNDSGAAFTAGTVNVYEISGVSN